MDRISRWIEICVRFFDENVLEPVKQMSFIDCIDVLLLTAIFYMVIRFVSNRRAGKLAVGCVLIVGVFLIAEALDMHAMKYIVSNFYQVGLIAIIIIFQDELRTALEKVGGISSKIVKGLDKQKIDAINSEVSEVADNISDAVFEMSATNTGALIVIEQDTKVGEFISGNAIVIDAKISSALIQNIFVNKTPLHDGAVIIRDFRIAAAGCRLPATKNKLPGNPGMRHNAAMGLSEVASDAIVIVVSEETGIVSLCYNGEMKRGYTKDKLTKELKGRLSKQKKKKVLAEQKLQEMHKKSDAGDIKQ